MIILLMNFSFDSIIVQMVMVVDVQAIDYVWVYSKDRKREVEDLTDPLFPLCIILDDHDYLLA